MGEEYTVPSELKERFVRHKDGGLYYRTQLEVYQAHGWLNFGSSCWEDRKKSAEILATSHHIGFGEPIRSFDFSKPFVDGNGTHYVSEVAYFNQEVYNSGIRSIENELIKRIVIRLIVDDKTVLYPNSSTNWRIRKINIATRRLLCEGLDMLVRHYMPKFKKVEITGFSNVRVI